MFVYATYYYVNIYTVMGLRWDASLETLGTLGPLSLKTKT